MLLAPDAAVAGFLALAAEAGALLISPATALPGSLPGVIAVDIDFNCPRDQFREERSSRGVIFFASGYPRPIPGVPPGRNLNGISFAVANMTGFAARVFAKLANRDYESVCAALETGSSSNPRS